MKRIWDNAAGAFEAASWIRARGKAAENVLPEGGRHDEVGAAGNFVHGPPDLQCEPMNGSRDRRRLSEIAPMRAAQL